MHEKLAAAFDPRGWWPAETPFEVIAGAILTHQTAWKNVEKAMENLKKKRLMDNDDPLRLARAPIETIQECVKCTGFYKQKAARLKKTAAYFAKYPSLGAFFQKPIQEARRELLSLDGIGPETADSILLYAGNKPVFVIDAYTLRACERVLGKKFSYHEAQKFFEKNLPRDAELFKEFHALLVELGKRHCRTKPLCASCPLEKDCLHSSTLGLVVPRQ